MGKAMADRTVQAPLQPLAELLSFLEKHLCFKEFIQANMKLSEEGKGYLTWIQSSRVFKRDILLQERFTRFCLGRI